MGEFMNDFLFTVCCVCFGFTFGYLKSATDQDKYLAKLVEYYEQDHKKAVNKFYTGEKPWEEDK